MRAPWYTRDVDELHMLDEARQKTRLTNTCTRCLSANMKATVCALSPSQDPYRSQIEGMLSTHVLPTFASAHGHLRAKAAWLAKEFAGVHFSDGRGKGALFNALLQAVIHSLSDRCVYAGAVNIVNARWLHLIRVYASGWSCVIIVTTQKHVQVL